MSARGRTRKAAPSADVLSLEGPARTEVAAFEFYPTPRDTIEMLIRSPLLSLPGGHWIDPCVGSARIPSTVNALRSDVTWTLCDIDARHRDAITAQMTGGYVLLPFGDFVTCEWRSERADVLIMNPPFTHALEFVKASFERADWIVMLQRVNWLSRPRDAWLRLHCPDVYSLPERPSFTGDGKTDATEYAWFVWPPDGRDRRFGRVAMLDGLAAHVQSSLWGAA